MKKPANRGPRRLAAGQNSEPLPAPSLANDAGLSLDQLSNAFAAVLAAGQDPYQSAPEDPVLVAIDDVAPDSSAEADKLGVDTDACPISPRTILEAMLFVGGNEPLTSQRVAGLMRGVRPAEIDALVRELNDDYAARHCPYQILAEGAGYALRLRQRYERIGERLQGRSRQSRLSQPAIEVLSIVAFEQPITADEVACRRGKPSGAILALLVRRQLLKLDRPPGRGAARRTVYSTTDRFLSFFSLQSLDDLPRSD